MPASSSFPSTLAGRLSGLLWNNAHDWASSSAAVVSGEIWQEIGQSAPKSVTWEAEVRVFWCAAQ